MCTLTTTVLMEKVILNLLQESQSRTIQISVGQNIGKCSNCHEEKFVFLTAMHIGTNGIQKTENLRYKIKCDNCGKCSGTSRDLNHIASEWEKASDITKNRG